MPDDEVSTGAASAGAAPSEIHEVIRRQGESDLARHSAAVALSGFAAGLSMGFSVLAMAMVRSALPDAPWRILLSGFGYSLGFLIVVLGGQQLFTETTLTAVLPVLAGRSWRAVPTLLRYWAVVLATNLVGTALFALVLCHPALFQPAMWDALCGVSAEAMRDSFWPMLVKAVFAGWLIALMIWLLPGAGSARMLVILTLTYFVAIGHFSHVIAGSVEAAFAVLNGQVPPLAYLTHFLLPTVIGNTLGGVALVALLNHAPLAAEA